MKKIGVIYDPRLKVKRAIPVTETRMENGELLLWSCPLGHFGAGRSFGEAATDFAKSLPDVYWFLKEHETTLGRGLLHELKFARAYIEERKTSGAKRS